ncbi:IPT/TIG domain-containing protein [Sphingobacterium pedocola]|uniref:IPT/TIG domain-containing protein n=1 Tax=Sphingobacterium pedocola TaxID=2082722 RepID=A0ABR9T9J2_9SPHI|nr:IPT/TIG domain-containing protein [Sphingobacterium pedocola]MBE8721978.1 hypothetical protein [Sphingobacterium pedocola]
MKSIIQQSTFMCLLVGLFCSACSREEVQGPTNDAPIPRILELSPANAAAGDKLTLVGLNFSENMAENIVRFGQQTVEILSATETEIEVVVPELTGSQVGVSVRSRGKVSNKAKLVLVRAKVFGDDFNRSNVEPVTSSIIPNPLGANWQIIQGSFGLTDNRLFSSAGGLESYVLYRDAELNMQVGDGSYFKLTADMQSSPESFAGIIFNAQSDNKRFYLLRTTNSMLQLLKSGENGVGHWVNVMVNENFEGFAPNTSYRATITSSQPGVFNITIINSTTNAILFERSVEDASPYLGGSPGFYYFGLANPVNIAFDNLNLEIL